MSSKRKVVRVWTIYAAPSIIDRVRALSGINARLIPNSGCSAYPEEQTVEERERVVQASDTPGGAIYSKKSVVEVVEWRQLRAGRSFMPNAPSAAADLREPGYWDRIYEQAGDALIAFLRQHPKP